VAVGNGFTFTKVGFNFRNDSDAIFNNKEN
jgi:hypothetical protein